MCGEMGEEDVGGAQGGDMEWTAAVGVGILINGHWCFPQCGQTTVCGVVRAESSGDHFKCEKEER